MALLAHGSAAHPCKFCACGRGYVRMKGRKENANRFRKRSVSNQIEITNLYKINLS